MASYCPESVDQVTVRPGLAGGKTMACQETAASDQALAGWPAPRSDRVVNDHDMLDRSSGTAGSSYSGYDQDKLGTVRSLQNKRRHRRFKFSTPAFMPVLAIPPNRERPCTTAT